MGETRAAIPLIEQLLANGKKVLLSHMTASGRSTSEKVFASAIAHGRLRQVYVPYDFCWPVMRFLRHFQPPVGLLMETEIWPGLLYYAQSMHVPIYLINGRLSAKSYKNFSRWGSVSKFLCSLLSGVAAQSDLDAKHYRSLGIENIDITGNLKFDVHLSEELINLGQHWKNTLWLHRPVIMAASTREGEENLIIQAVLRVKHPSNPLLLIVPRHLKRMDDIEDVVKTYRLKMSKRSQFQEKSLSDMDVVIGDSFGEMAAYFSASDIVVMGGTLKGTGEQNLIEPCALGKPVILGPSIYNFAQVSEFAISSGAAVSLKNLSALPSDEELISSLAKVLEELLSNPQKTRFMSDCGVIFTRQHQGATQRTLRFLTTI
jgi:3-deoxy-D-manno-octulosonic-acid transferase